MDSEEVTVSSEICWTKNLKIMREITESFRFVELLERQANTLPCSVQ